MDQVTDVLDNLDIEPTSIQRPIRLGKKITSGGKKNKPRLLKVTISNTHVQKQVLKQAKNLKSCGSETMSKVFITPDLTLQEREENRKLRDELKARRDKGETDLVIRNGKIVQKQEHNFRNTADTEVWWEEKEKTAPREQSSSSHKKHRDKGRRDSNKKGPAFTEEPVK